MGSNLQLNILFVVPYTPNLIRTRPFNLIKGLAVAGHRVTLATLWNDDAELESLRQLNPFLHSLIAERIGRIHSGWNCLRAIVSSQPLQASYSWCPSLMKKISDTLGSGSFDVVHVEHLRGARYAVQINSSRAAHGGISPPVVWDSVDCISDLFRRASKSSLNPHVRLAARIELPRTERFEGWLLSQFAQTVVTTEADKHGLLASAQRHHRINGNADSLQERVAIIPNGVDLSYFCPGKDPRETETLVISGKMSYHANVTAVLRFVKFVMPRIWIRYPAARLWIVGKDPAPEIRKLGVHAPLEREPRSRAKEPGDDRIRITGTVEDVRPYLRRATLAVAPIRYGVGIQNKILESMACGTPVVATPEAVQALRVRRDHHLVVENGEQGLADSICSLIADPERCSSLGHAGRAFVEANHDWQLAVRMLTRVYQNARSRHF
jgi:polysaccharide biosynthesis protein PslH